MGSEAAGWVRSLTAGTADAATPICFPPTIAAATARIGPGAVAWAVATAQAQAGLNLVALPRLTASLHDHELVRLAVEPAVIAVLVSIHAGAVAASPVPDEIRFVLREYVRRQVPLGAMWASILRGHGRLAETLNAACRRLVEPADQAAQLELVSRVLFEYVGQLSVGAGEVYAEEERLWSQTDDRARQLAVRAVLAGERTDTDALAIELRYRFEHRTHVGLVLRRDTVVEAGPDLEQLAAELLERLGATNRLVLPIGALEVWGWGSGVGEALRAFDDHALLDTARGVQGAGGNTGRGLAGFRRTHRQAQSAARTSALLDGPRRSVAAFADLALLSLLTADQRQASEFVQEELGALATTDGAMADLRETLLMYLECNRSPQTAALRLFVSRNTVTYRVNRAEALLGHSLAHRETEVRAALRLARVAGTLTPGEVPDN